MYNIRLVEAGFDYDQAGRFFDLGENFIFDSRQIESNISITKKMFGHGGSQTGNKKIKARTITITGQFSADSTETTNDKINEFLSFVSAKKMKLYVIGVTERKYLDGVYWKNSGISDIIYNDRISKTFTLEVEYPFWLSDTDTTQTNTLNSGDVFTITNSGAFTAYPIFTIKNLSGATCSTFSIKNKTDNNIICRISDTNFNNNDEIVINSVKGTITKNDVSILQYLDGTFLKILQGINNIEYKGNSGIEISTKYNKEYLQ